MKQAGENSNSLKMVFRNHARKMKKLSGRQQRYLLRY